ncbi:hypothetical protein CBR_g538 [Chara braunii]|uniref:Uncharacterized protein n=1 Tax=Chara braunii TaxID=69332 RepID=A0A388KBG2_CHABU|nr:hypothetical protein CBR_g538 [Chara braunii]|eukprot:GBG67402.1 hypothetical protein CBR_g538 [Chara braunii]
MMMVFSLWMLRDWKNHHHPSPPSLPPPVSFDAAREVRDFTTPIYFGRSDSLTSPADGAQRRRSGGSGTKGWHSGDKGGGEVSDRSSSAVTKWSVVNVGGVLLPIKGIINRGAVSTSSSSSSSSSFTSSSSKSAGIGIGVSPYQRIDWRIPDIPKPDFDKLPATWFIFTFLALGVFTFVVSFVGLIATDCQNDCCLCLYIFGLVLLVAGHGMLVAAVITDKHLDKDIPKDPTGEVEKAKEYVLNHKKICMILMGVVLGAEMLTLIFSIILKTACGGRRRYRRGSSRALQAPLLPETDADIVGNTLGPAAAGQSAGVATRALDYAVEPEYEYLPQAGEVNKTEAVPHRVTPGYDSLAGKTMQDVVSISRQSTSSGSPRMLPTDGVVLVTRRSPRLVRDAIWVLNNHDVPVRVCLHNKKHEYCFHKEEINPGCARPMSCSALRSIKLYVHLMTTNKQRHNLPVYGVILSSFNNSMRPGASANSIMVSLSHITKWDAFTADSRFQYHYSFPGGFKPTVEAVEDPYAGECRILHGTMGETQSQQDATDSQEDMFENEILTAVEDISSPSQTGGDFSSSMEVSRPADQSQWNTNTGKSFTSTTSGIVNSTFSQAR